MKIIKAFPPNWAKLTKHFPIKGKQGILYAYGDRLYNPSGIEVHPWLLAHEEVHGQRQERDVQGWWRSYIKNSGFRLKEEILAHRQEWTIYREKFPGSNNHNYLINVLANRLSSPLYGSLISHDMAAYVIEYPIVPEEVLKTIIGADKFCDVEEPK